MTTTLVLALFLLVLLGGLAVFLVLEFYAISNEDDEFHTLSTYIKRARRRTGTAGAIVLSLMILLPAAWLFGHLVFEAW
jgi:hypothetical protein